MSVEVGEQAPDFELKDQHGSPVRLSSFQGTKNVVLVFYPLAFSGVCSGELSALRDDFPRSTRRTSNCSPSRSIPRSFCAPGRTGTTSASACCQTSGRTAMSQSFTEYLTRTRAWRRGEPSSLIKPESSGGKW